MKTIKITLMGLMLIATSLFAYAKFNVDSATFCHQKMGGPGLCVTNGNSGFKCIPVDYLGDCEGTFSKEIPSID